uniref:Uncharacterized protein n=1 Tax=Picea glauca TaxID=3330 RepID=A0A101M5N8_PICGL|nr:hypothetical protein ABT39_MTgene1174 [Picea glauca]
MYSSRIWLTTRLAQGVCQYHWATSLSKRASMYSSSRIRPSNGAVSIQPGTNLIWSSYDVEPPPIL